MRAGCLQQSEGEHKRDVSMMTGKEPLMKTFLSRRWMTG